MWRGCGERVGREVESREGRHSAALNLQKVSDIPTSVQGDWNGSVQSDGNLHVLGPCAASHAVLGCGKAVISLG